MSGPQLVKQIHQLTYSEMLTVSEHLSIALMRAEMKEKPGESVSGPAYSAVAHALLSLTAPTDVLAQEEKLLRQLFRRKRAIAVELKGAGWHTDITTLSGAQASGVNLREALNRTLDQIITLQALQK